MISALNGYNFTAIMPGNMSKERIEMMKEFGAKILVISTEEGMGRAVKRYNEMLIKYSGAWFPKQFENYDNPNAQEYGLGKEIIEQTKSKVNTFVAGIGTGGILIGVARTLKKANPNVKIVGVEPDESAALSGKKQDYMVYRVLEKDLFLSWLRKILN